MKNKSSLKGIRFIRFLARYLPAVRGRDIILVKLSNALNKKWPEQEIFVSQSGLMYELDLTDPNYRSFYLFGFLEKDLTWVIDHLISKDDIVIEGGAGVGIFTVMFASGVGSGGQVHAFEPLPAAYHRAHRNVLINGLDNVFLNRIALGERKGYANVYWFSNLPQGHASLVNLLPELSQGFMCEVTTVDSYCRERAVRRVDFIKLDVEGSELPALRGSIETIEKWHPVVVVEANLETSAAFGYKPSDIISWFAKFDYSCLCYEEANVV
jgi:FkbM family methyltransferase